jgi:hypothetical protein
MAVDVTDKTVKNYQTARLKEKAAPKTINEEVGFLLRLLGEAGEPIRARLRRQKALKLAIREQVGKAYTPEEKAALLAAARAARSAGDANDLMERSPGGEMAREKWAARDEKCAAPARVTPLWGVMTQNAGTAQMVGFLWDVRRDRADARVVPVSTTGEDQLGGKMNWLNSALTSFPPAG